MTETSKTYLSVVLPAYCEEENLRILIPRLKTTLTQTKLNFEICIIDSLQKLDHTEELCKESQINYFKREGGETFGDAVRTGIKKAQGEYILFMDADGSHPPEFIPELLKEHKNNDIVIASRYVEGGFTENSKALIWMSKTLNIAYGVILGLHYKDISNSFKIYKATLLNELTLTCSNFDIIEEILYKIHLNKKNLKVKEVPFSFKKRMFGETKRNLILFMITFFYTMIKLRFSRH